MLLRNVPRAPRWATLARFKQGHLSGGSARRRVIMAAKKSLRRSQLNDCELRVSNLATMVRQVRLLDPQQHHAKRPTKSKKQKTDQLMMSSHARRMCGPADSQQLLQSAGQLSKGSVYCVKRWSISSPLDVQLSVLSPIKNLFVSRNENPIHRHLQRERRTSQRLAGLLDFRAAFAEAQYRQRFVPSTRGGCVSITFRWQF